MRGVASAASSSHSSHRRILAMETMPEWIVWLIFAAPFAMLIGLAIWRANRLTVPEALRLDLAQIKQQPQEDSHE
jgi:hypothetical protein